MSPLRTHKAYIASIGHRLSGLALAIFLPFHFLLLGEAVNGEQGLDGALAFTGHFLFKIAEWGLVVFLTLHLFFGLRVLLLEFTNWPRRNELLVSWIAPSIAASLFVGAVFLLQSF